MSMAVLPGIMELVVLLGFGGGIGVPLGIPPAPEDPLMGRVAPQECIFYSSWAGTTKPDPASSNQTEQLLAEPEIQNLINEVKTRVLTGLREKAGEDPGAAQVLNDAVQWGERLLTSPAAVFVSKVSIPAGGPGGPTPPEVEAGLLIGIGDDAPKFRATLEKYQAIFLPRFLESVEIAGDTWHRLKLDEKAPPITWGTKGKYVLLGVGEGTIEGMLSRATTAPPDWYTELRGQLPVDRMSMVGYVNLQKVLQTVVPMAGLRGTAIIDALGLGNVTSMASVSGLHGEGYVSRSLLGIDGDAAGLLRLFDDQPLSPQDLTPIPSDATVALAARINGERILDIILDTAGKIEPRAVEEIQRGLDEMSGELGVNVREELLKSLGDVVCVYNSPSEGGFVITGLTAVVQVKDPAALKTAQDKLIAILKEEFNQDDPDLRRTPRIEQFSFAGQDIHFFNARDDDFPLAPAWCLTEGELIVAPFPQNIKSYLLRDTGAESLAARKDVAALFGPAGGPMMLAYADTPELFKLAYPALPFFAQVITAELQREGIDVDVSLLPSAGSIGKHLRPNLTAVRRTAAGVEVFSSQTLPGGSITSTAPMAVGLLLPAVQSARAAARRAASMNNMKQIGLAMHMYHDSHRKFPAAYIADEDGKPLLSWRVAILPYIEEQALYERFNLDEPWDSENNRKLIPLMPQVYRNPDNRMPPGRTSYLTVRGDGTVFPGSEGVTISDIRDGSSNTIMFVEAADYKSVEWTKPDDFVPDEDDPLEGLRGARPNGFNAAFCDGSVRFIPESIDSDTLKALFTRSGGEVVERDW